MIFFYFSSVLADIPEIKIVEDSLFGSHLDFKGNDAYVGYLGTKIGEKGEYNLKLESNYFSNYHFAHCCAKTIDKVDPRTLIYSDVTYDSKIDGIVNIYKVKYKVEEVMEWIEGLHKEAIQRYNDMLNKLKGELLK